MSRLTKISIQFVYDIIFIIIIKNCYSFVFTKAWTPLLLGRSKEEDGGVVGVSATKKKDAILSLPFF